MTDYRQIAAAVIAKFEAFQPVAKWDVNHYRLGFGSDTEGPDQVNVVRGMTTTRERAAQNLDLRIPKYEAEIVSQVGQSAWDRVSVNAKVALLSVCYNYGSLPERLADTVKSGLPASVIANAIKSLSGDNHGVNAGRREAEATLARTADAPVPPATPTAPPAAKPALDLSTTFDILDALGRLGFANPIKAFQTRYGLVADGDPGPLTRAMITKLLAT